MGRLTPLDLDNLTPEQQSVYDAMQSGPRGARHGKLGLVGPFGVWVRAPGIGDAVQALGAAARFETSIDEATKEVAICTVGAHYKARFEFATHQALAIQAGISEAATVAIQQGQIPVFDSENHKVCHLVAQQLLDRHCIDNETYQRATAIWGEEGMIELVSIIGYYCIVSLTLNAFEVPIVPGMQDPFPDLE